MRELADLSTNELSRTRVRLREGLRFLPIVRGGESMYRLEDPARSRFFEIGYAEYLFLSLLDGSTSFAAALTLAARKLGAQAFTEEDAIAIGLWLVENGLATPVDGRGRAIGGGARSGSRPRREPNTLLSIKIPLFNPDRLLKSVVKRCGWVCSPAALATMAALWVWAIVIACGRGAELSAASAQLFARDNWLKLIGCWVGLKLVHEFAHGLTCRFYGGEVPETGLAISMFTPMAYVDVTSSWGFSSSWRRIHVALAGMLFEITLAAIAMIAWPYLRDESSRHLLLNVMVTASVTTVVFNLNPLMRFDGYYVLSDLLGIPNLGVQSTQALQATASRWLLGRRMMVHLPAGWRKLVVWLYGVAALLWKVVVVSTLVVAAAVMFRGAGIALVAVMVGVSCLPMILGLAKVLLGRWQESRWGVVRAVSIGAALAVGAVWFVTVMPSPLAHTAPAVVDYSELAVVRSTTPGFVTVIHVADGDRVEAGQILAELSNEDLEREHADLRLAILQSETKRIALLNKQEVGEAQAEARNRQALDERLSELTEKRSALVLRAPVEGRVVARRLEDRLGSYLKEGDEFITVGSETRKEVLASVAQSDVELFLGSGSTGRLLIPGQGYVTASFVKGTPRASTTLPHPALSAAAGGPLSVEEKGTGDRKSIELAEPRFLVRLRLSDETAARVPAGRLGMLYSGTSERSLWRDVRKRAREWVKQVQERAAS
jgi:putative peptide zinc metalloprotease protein